jgi:amino acid permease
MKKAGLIIGILLTLLGGIGAIVCLLLPSLTNNRVKFEESLLGLIPAVIFFFLGLLITLISAVLIFKARKKTN